jgi:hypothetical protein
VVGTGPEKPAIVDWRHAGPPRRSGGPMVALLLLLLLLGLRLHEFALLLSEQSILNLLEHLEITSTRHVNGIIPSAAVALENHLNLLFGFENTTDHFKVTQQENCLPSNQYLCAICKTIVRPLHTSPKSL